MLENKKFEDSHNAIVRVQKILTELTGSLRHDMYPELCGKICYTCNDRYRRLICANTAHDLNALTEAVEVLRYQRETWSIMMQQLAKGKAAEAAANMEIPEPSADGSQHFHARIIRIRIHSRALNFLR